MTGKKILHYRIIEQIGSGGMGVVYKAEDTRLRRFVALKFLPEHLARNETSLERVRREARAIAALDHPNIRTVYDIAEFEGQPFIVMQWLDGETLASKIAGPRLSVEEVRSLGSQIAEGLSKAHAAGIIHRDIKPGNIFVTKEGQVKILDFGLAMSTDPAVDDLATVKLTAAANLTAAGCALGTPAYMSPEQALGKELDARTDLFSFGIVLYQMATGQPPFKGNSGAAIVDQIIHETPPYPTTLDPSLPDVLDRIIIKAMAKSPADRYSSAPAMAADLSRLTPHRSGMRQRFPVLRRIRISNVKSFLRHAVVIVALAIAGVAFWRSREPVLSFAETDTLMLGTIANLTGDQALDGTIRDALRISIEQSRYVDVLTGNRVRQALLRMRKSEDQPLTDDIAQEVCLRENARAFLAGSISRDGTRYDLTLKIVNCVTGDPVATLSESAGSREEILNTVDSLANKLRLALGESRANINESQPFLDQVTTKSLDALKLFSDGNFLWSKGKYEEARKLHHRAIELDPEFARAYASLGNAYAAYNINIEKAEQYFQEALKRMDQLTERERNEIRGLYYSSRGQYAESVSYWRLLTAAYPKVDWYRHNLGRQFQNLHQYEDAVAAYQEALRLNQYNSGALINIATCYTTMKQPDKAIEFYQKAFAQNPDMEVDLILNHEYGWALVQLDRPEQARAVFEKMLTKSGNYKARGYRSLGILALFRGELDEAARNLDEASRLDELGGAYDGAARDVFYLGEAFVLVGRTQKGLEYLDRANRLAQLSGPPAWLALHLSAAYSRAGRTAQAESLIQSVRAKVRPDNPGERAFLLLAEAELSLAIGPSEEALEKLRAAKALNPGAMSGLALARGLIRTGHGSEAIPLLQEILTFPTSAWDSHVSWVLAHRDLAALYAMSGQKAEAQARYARLFALWAKADPNLTALVQAREEMSRLGGS